MAIKINNTEVIDNDRVLRNIASIDTSSINKITGNYTARALLESAISGGLIPIDGMLYSDGVSLYVGSAGSTNISTLPGLDPFGTATPEHFGALGDWNGTSGTDDTEAFEELIIWCTANRSFLQLGANKNYRITAPLDINAFSLNMYGQGKNYSVITADHLNGEVLRNKRSNCNYWGFKIDASPTRRAAVGLTEAQKKAQYGIRHESPDTSSLGGAHCSYYDLQIVGQPGHAFIGHAGNLHVEQLTIADCAGHAICIDPGYELGRTNNSFVGWTRIISNDIDNCYGHAICIGHPMIGSNNDTTYRIELRNNDSAKCASGASPNVIHYASQYYVVGEQIVIENNGINCQVNAIAGQGIYIAGIGIRLEGNRLLSAANAGITVGNLSLYPTRGVTIKDTRVINVNPFANLSNLVAMPSSGDKDDLAIRIDHVHPANITNICSNTSLVLEMWDSNMHGSNANGTWLKFPNGRMVCWKNDTRPSVSSAIGSGYESANDSWTFPTAFVATPVISGHSTNGDWACPNNLTSSGCNIKLRSFSSTGTSVDYTVQADGNWFI